ncbi:MAG: fructosamine kinase family protein [Methylococcaceae bacterium]|nr:fructosamine kinase family protein [Prolixibacteraceae bacterium]
MIEAKENAIIELCIQKLSDLQGTSVQLKGKHPLGGGCINHAVKLDTTAGDYFLKWHATAPSDIFVKEGAGLDEMRSVDNPYLRIPKVIWSKEADEWPGLLLIEYLPDPTTHSGYDERLGRGIAVIHRHTASAYGFHHSNYCGNTLQDNTWTQSWPEFYAVRRIEALIKQLVEKRGMPSDEQKVYSKLTDKMPQLLSHSTTPSLIHGDLWSGNYMYTADGPALIDPACYYADREMELGMMQLFGGFSTEVWDAYQDEFPLPEGWQQRIELYQLYHVLNHYLLFGGSYGTQALHIARQYL